MSDAPLEPSAWQHRWRRHRERETIAAGFCATLGVLLDTSMLDHDLPILRVPVILKDKRRIVVEEPFPAQFPSDTWKVRVTALA